MKKIIPLLLALPALAFVLETGVNPASQASASDKATQTVTFDSLLREMTDRSMLANFPKPSYKCIQHSSYDRASKKPNPKDGYKYPSQYSGVGWFTNGDNTQYLRTETKNGRKEHVMMEHKGPGAVSRIWVTTTNAYWRNKMILRVYIDGSDTPVIEGALKDIIGRSSELSDPLNYGKDAIAPYPLSYTTSLQTPEHQRGRNLYLPIPFAKSCKITMDKSSFKNMRGWNAFYYQVNFRAYDKGTKVESFTKDSIKNAAPVIKTVCRELLTGRPDMSGTTGVRQDGIKIAPGKTHTLKLDAKNGSAIKQIKMNVAARNLAQAMRSTVVDISFDGKQAIWVPLGDFFLAGYTTNPVKCFYSETDGVGNFTSWWVMPFQKTATIRIRNLGKQHIRVASLAVNTADWTWNDRSMYFHGAWREYRHTPACPHRDMNFLEVKGQGVWVGDVLSVWNTDRNWWGEGDEKIYVDGEAFPSHFGTGSEDYYGYAWCKGEPFNRPFNCVPDGKGNRGIGLSVNVRVRAIDAIPFQKSIKFDMELWHATKNRRGLKVNYAPSSFFYARPGATWNVKPDPAGVKHKLPRTQWDILRPARKPAKKAAKK